LHALIRELMWIQLFYGYWPSWRSTATSLRHTWSQFIALVSNLYSYVVTTSYLKMLSVDENGYLAFNFNTGTYGSLSAREEY
jgi:chitinase